MTQRRQSPSWDGAAWNQVAWNASTSMPAALVVYVDPARCVLVAKDPDIWGVDPKRAELIH